MTEPETGSRSLVTREEARRRVLIALQDQYVAPRFDRTCEVLLVDLDGDGSLLAQRTVVLPEVSAEAICHLVISDGVDEVVCGAMEEEYYQYLTWKKVRVLDSVVAEWEDALSAHRAGRLAEGDVLIRPDEEE
jgi:predicted Fe-Mo cluster-binding NifX family protein